MKILYEKDADENAWSYYQKIYRDTIAWIIHGDIEKNILSTDSVYCLIQFVFVDN